MIEQTPLVVSEWHYHSPSEHVTANNQIKGYTSFEVQRKRASTKKGIACRFSCRFSCGDETILQYTGEDSYVIDFEEAIDKNEVLRMIRNSFSKFKETFDLRKSGTVLQYRSLKPLDESQINLDAILLLLI